MKRLSIVLSICLVLALAAPVAAKTTFVSIGTGGTGGIYYPYGGGVAEIWNKHAKGVRAVAEVTGASVENVKLAHKGETVIGESEQITVDEAMRAITIDAAYVDSQLADLSQDEDLSRYIL